MHVLPQSQVNSLSNLHTNTHKHTHTVVQTFMPKTTASAPPSMLQLCTNM